MSPSPQSAQIVSKESEELKSLRKKIEEYGIAFRDMEQEFSSKIDKIYDLLKIEKREENVPVPYNLPSTLTHSDMSTIASVLAQVRNWNTQSK